MPPVLQRLVKASIFFGLTTILVAPTSVSAGSDWYSDPGTLGTSDGWASTLTFSDPVAVATFSVTNAGYKAVGGDSTCMTTDPCGWWGVDDANGTGDGSSSLSNSEAAFTPSNVKDYEGVTWTWRSTLCESFPTVASPSVSCPNVSKVTIDFDVPVTNAIIHVNNLGGNGTFPGYDFTLFSQWTLTSGQRLIQLSGSDTTNITLAGDTIRNRFTPQGLGARVSNGESTFNDPSTFYDNGTGSGSFLVPGTYQRLTFEVDLKWSLVNYTSGTPSTDDIPEGVSVQLSFFDGPLPPTEDHYDDYQLPSVDAQSEALPNTGPNVLPAVVLASIFLFVGAGIGIRCRRRYANL